MSASQGESSRVPWVLEDKHRIFLSHSGAQKDFVLQLNKDFKNSHRYPFFDMEPYSLPPGESFPPHIFQAIEQCDVGVVVLSEEFFTRSHWPMTELVEMVKSEKKIVPIFLKISPEDLKKEDNVARWISEWETMKKSNDRIDIGKWTEVLKRVRTMKGPVCKDRELEFQFRKEILKAVNRIVPAWSRWDGNLIEARSRICKAILDKVLAMEACSSGRPRVVGLYGVGGIGKTTACKCMVDNLSTDFHGRVCHIEFNNESTHKERFQEVLRRLTNSNHKVLKKMSEEECNNERKSIEFGKVFLALDNVSCDTKMKEEVIDYLEAKYHEDSIVLVAARPRDALLELKINGDHCLAMPELEEGEAKAMFLKHVAQSMVNVDNVGRGLVSRCVQRCCFDKGDGSKTRQYHPLALKVLGDQLGTRDPKDWTSLIQGYQGFNLRREQEHPVFSILRSSFDALLAEDQALFMDVALFNIGVVCHIFEESMEHYGAFCLRTIHEEFSFFQWLAAVHEVFETIKKGMSMELLLIKLESLKRKSLFEVIGDGKSAIGMHDLWREFAVKETERGEIPARRWVYETVGGKAVDSILADGGWKKLQRICLMGETDDGNTRPSVKCLNFSNCKNVTVLRLVDVVVEDDAGLDLSPLIQLKILEILADEEDPVSVRGFEKLKNLRILVWVNMGDKSLDTLGEISNLRNLRVLHLVSAAQGPPATLDLSKLWWLEYLRVYFPYAEEVTISGLSSKMANLRIVDFSLGKTFRSCPGVGYVTNLEVLSLFECKYLEGLPDLKKLSKLRILDVTYCRLLKTIEGLPGLIALEEFRADGCWELNGVPDLSGLPNLRRLDLMYCDEMHHIPGLSNLIALQELHVSSKILDTGPYLHNLRNLESVTIGLSESWIGECESLDEHLDLSEDRTVSSLEMLGVHCDERTDYNIGSGGDEVDVFLTFRCHSKGLTGDVLQAR